MTTIAFGDTASPLGVGALATLSLVYLSCLVAHRLALSPLARFPGPRLAALTNWYEFYYDVVLAGRFTQHIQGLHKRYGPIVRITPTELHIDDPDYFDTLYARAGRRDKYSYFSRFSYASHVFATADHDLHRVRRKALSPFSAAKISDSQPVIHDKVDVLCRKLAAYRPGQAVRLGRAWMALTTDIISEYAFARPYDHLESPGFDVSMQEALAVGSAIGHFQLHLPVVFPLLDRLPAWLVRVAWPDMMPVKAVREDLNNQVRDITAGTKAHQSASHPTIFHELLHSDMPPEEKSNTRLGDEAQLIVVAGLATTARALTVASFYLCREPHLAARLRSEVGHPVARPDWRQLDKLPFLNACVFESIRLSHGVSTRDPRLAPDTELTYRGWTIPKNTPVSTTTVDVLMNPHIFPEPGAFVPERWIDNPGLQRYFVPFGKGTRQCLGVNLAMAELYIAIATVFTRFTFDLFETDESDIKMKHAYVLPFPRFDSKGVRVTVQATLP